MKHLNRRQFLATLGPLALMALRQKGPDLILHHANIITVNPAQPRAQALALSGDRIVAVGSNDDILRLATSSTRKVNVGGNTITPGFIDAHSHPAYSGRAHLRNVDADLRSIPAIQQGDSSESCPDAAR